VRNAKCELLKEVLWRIGWLLKAVATIPPHTSHFTPHKICETNFERRNNLMDELDIFDKLKIGIASDEKIREG